MVNFLKRLKKRKYKIKTLISIVPGAATYLPEGCLDINKFAHSAYTGFENSGYSICIELEKCCDHLQYFPDAKSFVVTSKNLCELHNRLEPLVENVASVLNVSESEAVRELSNFFENKTVNVLPGGVQGSIYKIGSAVQTYLPAAYSMKVITTAKTLGVSGVGILSTTPLFAIALGSTGALFFTGMGVIVGDNVLGKTCNAIGWTLNRPMAGVELVLNSFVLSPITKLLGVPLLLNSTKELSGGVGIDIETVRGIASKAKNKYGARLISWAAGKIGFNITIN